MECKKETLEITIPFWLTVCILLATFALGVLVHKVIINPTTIKIAEVVQETSLILQVEDGRQYQFLELSGGKENQYAIYVNPRNNRVRKVVQVQRVVFEE